MSFETPSTTTKRMLVKRQAVVTVTSVAEDSPTGTSSYTRPGAAKVPIGPIVGGIIAGVVAVCLVGGIWYWCHQKGEKEKEDRRIRALARTNKKNATRLNLSNHSKSAVSMQSVASTAEEKQMYSNKGGYNHGAPVGAVAASSPYVLDQDSRYAYGQERQYDSTPPSHGRQASDGRSYNQYVDAPVANPSNESASPRSAGSSGSRSPTGTTTSSSSSGSDKRSRAQQRIEAALEREAALAASNPVARYQPARPSPLRAAEERKEDEAVPKWGSKPFRSAQTDAAQHQSEELQRPAPVTLAPPLDLNAREKSTSGEWGVAYSDVDDGAGAFEHDDYDSRSDGRKSYGPEAVAFTATSPGRQPTGYGYNTDPLRGRTVSGSGAPLGSNTHGQGRGCQPAYDPYTRSYAEEQDHAGSHDPYAVPVHRGSQAGAF